MTHTIVTYVRVYHWSRINRNGIGWQQTSNFLRVPKVRTTGTDHGFTWPILSGEGCMLTKAGDGRSRSPLKTVQPVNDQTQFQEQDQEEETLLDQYQTRSRWIT